jgi:hypothetical protein
MNSVILNPSDQCSPAPHSSSTTIIIGKARTLYQRDRIVSEPFLEMWWQRELPE